MFMGHIKAIGICAIAIVFAAVQMFCVCAEASVSSPQMDHAMHQTIAAPENTHAHHMGTEQSSDFRTHDHGTHQEHSEVCQHCDGAAVSDAVSYVTPTLAAISDIKTVALPPQSHFVPSRADMAASALGGLRWLDPPARRPDTPVTLKTRLLT